MASRKSREYGGTSTGTDGMDCPSGHWEGGDSQDDADKRHKEAESGEIYFPGRKRNQNPDDPRPSKSAEGPGGSKEVSAIMEVTGAATASTDELARTLEQLGAMQSVPQHLASACREVFEGEPGVSVPFVSPLFENLSLQKRYRKRLFHPKRVRRIFLLQEIIAGDPEIAEQAFREFSQEGESRARQARKLRELIDQGATETNIVAKVYEVFGKDQKGGIIPIENILGMHGIIPQQQRGITPQQVRSFYFKEGNLEKPYRMIELAAGNAEITRVLHYWWLFEYNFALREQVNGNLLKMFCDQGNQSASFTVVDIAAPFIEEAQEEGFHAFQADICLPPEEFFATSGLKSHSFDRIFLNLALDRVPDVRAVLRNVRELAAPGATFMFGQSFPFQAIMDDSSGMPPIQCFDPESKGEPRRAWMNPDKEQAIFAFIQTLDRHLLEVKWVGEQPYEVYNPHCMVGTPEQVRANPRLQEYTSADPEILALAERIKDDALRASDFIDEKHVYLPQCYTLTLVAGKVISSHDMEDCPYT